MKRSLCLLLLLLLVAGCQQVPAGEPVKEAATKAVVVLDRVPPERTDLADPAEWVKVGSPVNLVFEEAGESPAQHGVRGGQGGWHRGPRQGRDRGDGVSQPGPDAGVRRRQGRGQAGRRAVRRQPAAPERDDTRKPDDKPK